MDVLVSWPTQFKFFNDSDSHLRYHELSASSVSGSLLYSLGWKKNINRRLLVLQLELE